jgi:hypothetical protein
MKTYGWVDEQIQEFLISKQFHAPAALPPWKEPPVSIG